MRPLKHDIIVAAIFSVWTLGVPPADAADPPKQPPSHPMTFEVANNGGNCSSCSWVAAEGRITENTPERFRAFIDEPPYARPIIRLHSAGGRVKSAIELGRELRRRGFTTIVGRTGEMNGLDTGEPGRCLSACAYLFLGGEIRELKSPSILGFHRFRNADPATKEALRQLENQIGVSFDQVMAGVLATYVDEMGVDPAIVYQAARTPSNRVFVPSPEKLERYGVITPELSWSSWEVTRNDAMLHYRSWYADTDKHKMATVLCRNGRFWLNIMARGEATLGEEGLRDVASPHISIGDTGRPVRGDDLYAGLSDGKTQFSVRLKDNEVARLADGQRIVFDAGVPHVVRSFFGDIELPALPNEDAEDMIDLMRRACSSR